MQVLGPVALRIVARCCPDAYKKCLLKSFSSRVRLAKNLDEAVETLKLRNLETCETLKPSIPLEETSAACPCRPSN
jgi:hypothetical protein